MLILLGMVEVEEGQQLKILRGCLVKSNVGDFQNPSHLISIPNQ